MTRIAIFVEGQTELILIRDFLLKKFEYEVGIDCLQLRRGGNLQYAPFQNLRPDANFYFQIINVGNDVRVLSAILEREKNLINAGYSKVIGLRDMYSEEYLEKSTIINLEITKTFIERAFTVINNNASSPEKISFCFSIMEVEAWIIGMAQVFPRINEVLTAPYIKERTGYDVEESNPEDYLRPSGLLSQILALAGIDYDKRLGEVEAICSVLTKEDFEYLNSCPKCESFSKFYNEIII